MTSLVNGCPKDELLDKDFQCTRHWFWEAHDKKRRLGLAGCALFYRAVVCTAVLAKGSAFLAKAVPSHCVVFLPRQCLCFVFPLPSWSRHAVASCSRYPRGHDSASTLRPHRQLTAETPPFPRTTQAGAGCDQGGRGPGPGGGHGGGGPR